MDLRIGSMSRAKEFHYVALTQVRKSVFPLTKSFNGKSSYVSPQQVLNHFHSTFRLGNRQNIPLPNQLRPVIVYDLYRHHHRRAAMSHY